MKTYMQFCLSGVTPWISSGGKVVPPIPVAARCKAWSCGHSLPEVAGSNPAGVMVICLFSLLCVVRHSFCDWPIPRPEEYYRVCVCVCLCVWSECTSNTLHLQWVGVRCRNKKEKKERSSEKVVKQIKYSSFMTVTHVLTYLLTPWSRVLFEKLTGFAANQEIPRILWNPKVHYRTHKRPPHVRLLLTFCNVLCT